MFYMIFFKKFHDMNWGKFWVLAQLAHYDPNVSFSLTLHLYVDVSHRKPGQVRHFEDARVGHVDLLKDELGSLHGQPALQLRVQWGHQNPLAQHAPVLIVWFGPVDDVKVGVVQVEFYLQVVSVGGTQEGLMPCGGSEVDVSAAERPARRPVLTRGCSLMTLVPLTFPLAPAAGWLYWFWVKCINYRMDWHEIWPWCSGRMS